MVLPPGYSLWLFFISPLCGVAQTPDCGIVNSFAPFRWVISDTRSVHPIPTPVLHVHILPACVHQGFRLFRDRRYDHKIFRSMITPRYILYPCSWCLRVHSNVLTGLSLAIVLARFLAWRGALRRQPRNLRNGDSSLAKIGVILVSCSCGKWSPIDADEPQTASAINH